MNPLEASPGEVLRVPVQGGLRVDCLLAQGRLGVQHSALGKVWKRRVFALFGTSAHGMMGSG